MEISRRRFLVGSISAIATSVAGFGCGTSPEGGAAGPHRTSIPETETDLREVLRTYFQGAELSSVKAVGRAYLERFETADGASQDLSKAVRLIADVEDRRAAVERLEARAVADFEKTRLAAVAGWQLARVEARLTALAASELG